MTQAASGKRCSCVLLEALIPSPLQAIPSCRKNRNRFSVTYSPASVPLFPLTTALQEPVNPLTHCLPPIPCEGYSCLGPGRNLHRFLDAGVPVASLHSGSSLLSLTVIIHDLEDRGFCHSTHFSAACLFKLASLFMDFVPVSCCVFLALVAVTGFAFPSI